MVLPYNYPTNYKPEPSAAKWVPACLLWLEADLGMCGANWHCGGKWDVRREMACGGKEIM